MNIDPSRGDELYAEDVFQVLLEYEISRSIRYPSPLSMIFIEFGASGYGSAEPGNTSTVFARALNRHLRSVDIPSGTGNQIKILLPTTAANGLRAVCERLLSVFKNELSSPDGSPIAFSLNLGAVSHAGGKSISREFLLENAALALEQSKLKGPNTFALLSFTKVG
jgi:hypothetical protein